jgi:hypothetical protein
VGKEDEVAPEMKVEAMFEIMKKAIKSILT